MTPPARRKDGPERDRKEARPGADAAARTSPAGLEAAAIDYLARYASSKAQLRRALERRIRRWAPREEADPAAARAAIPALLGKLERLGLLDDERFALTHAARLHGRGRSLGRIRTGLAQRGIDRETTAVALAAVRSANADPDFTAAAAFARRRRLGPYRPAKERSERRAKDLAALARAGFGYEIARRVLAAASAAELEAECRALEEAAR
jgi:regulatory protein